MTGAVDSEVASLTWRGPGHVLHTGVMDTPTMACLMDMVVDEVDIIRKESLIVRHLIGATVDGQSALQREETKLQPLRDENVVFLQADHHIRVWQMVSGPGPLDLLVVFESPLQIPEGDNGDTGKATVSEDRGHNM